MAIILSDPHGDPIVARAFLAHKPDDLHICLGDLTDSRKKVGIEAEQKCLDLFLDSDTLLLWGNHDLAYLPEHPWKCFGNFGEMAFRAQFQVVRDRFLAAYAVDGWLCTHAGVSPKVARLIPAETISAGAEAIAEWLNKEFALELQRGAGPLLNVPVCRGGVHEFGGIFWFDAIGEQTQPAPAIGRQIFGHTPVPYPERGKSWDLFGSGDPVPWINLNTLEGHWIYDTRTDELVQLR